jgi:hypothetical protein
VPAVTLGNISPKPKNNLTPHIRLPIPHSGYSSENPTPTTQRPNRSITKTYNLID